MSKIYYILGKSASGKDSIYRELMARKELDLKRIVLYTTRPMRTGEVSGRDYHFIDDAKKQELLDSGKVVEIRTYNTVHGPWSYLTLDEGFDDADYLAIGTLTSYEAMRKYYGKDKVIPIYIYIDDKTRLLRSIERESLEKMPSYEEVCRRFIADQGDYSEERLNALGINGGYENVDLLECVQKIVNDIIVNM